jgi:hypothetical protein
VTEVTSAKPIDVSRRIRDTSFGAAANIHNITQQSTALHQNPPHYTTIPPRNLFFPPA